ncbi:MAG: nucleoside recognition domain-containing protein [Alloprevotella sp.]|nr:nucleoside recognition domain-containing protein [Alloprevotella sp.]
MVLNYIWIAFFLIAFAVAVVRLLVFGDTEVFPNIINGTFETAKTAVDISLGLIGALSLWMGIMRIGEQGGVVNVLARWLGPVFAKLFPEVPRNHPVIGNIFMNLSANMLGLDNAATPLGLKAMEGLQSLNAKKDTASNAMIMFLVLNTSGLTIIPVSILVYRAQAGATQPTDVFLPILLATFISSLVGVIVTALVQRINLLNRTLLFALGGASLFMGCMVYGFSLLNATLMNVVSTNMANILLFLIIIAFIVAGLRKRINVYEAFIEGAKEGFTTSVRIIPYLVAILVAIGVFRASGGMQWLTEGMQWLVQVAGLPSEWVGALPTAVMKPLSGAGARGMMVDAMQTYGVDSLVGRLSCIFQGSTDTTFYILAVYFGSVGVRRTRHAVACGLAADLAGLIAAVFIAYFFFG